MTVEEFRKTMAETEYIPAGSVLHQAFHAFSQEALKITAELNSAYHTPEEVRALMSQPTASEIDKTFAMFPPF
ncbi:MAG: sugar O-acetyltransferase, partial [Kiritimatiellae bacterium]|nr:sugar O-acetyltransferase [Kiritimatiellia bacterium]